MKSDISVRTLFKATMPFVWLKLAMNMTYVIIVTIAAWHIISGFFNVAENVKSLHGGLRQGLVGVGQIQAILDGILELARNLGFWTLPFILVFGVAPAVHLIFRTVGRYFVRVGHIAVLTRIATVKKIPRNQVKWGITAVKRSFGRAATFFFLNRLIYRALTELQHVTNNLLSGLGPAAFMVNIFKGKLLEHIDECCLAYTYVNKGNGPFLSAAKGVAIYVKGWRTMAKAVLHIMCKNFAVSLVFYTTSAAIVTWGIVQVNLHITVAGVFILFFCGAAKRCVLDTYAMVAMLKAFLQEAEKQGKISPNDMNGIAAMSGTYGVLLAQANESDHFEEERQHLGSRQRKADRAVYGENRNA